MAIQARRVALSRRSSQNNSSSIPGTRDSEHTARAAAALSLRMEGRDLRWERRRRRRRESPSAGASGGGGAPGGGGVWRRGRPLRVRPPRRRRRRWRWRGTRLYDVPGPREGGRRRRNFGIGCVNVAFCFNVLVVVSAAQSIKETDLLLSKLQECRK